MNKEKISKKGRKILVSVIACTHNRSKKLLDTLNAIEKQTLSKDKYELIVVNDGSTDDTAEVLGNFKNNTKLNMKVIYQKDSGPAASRNTGLKHATGEIIAFTDDDCIPEKDWLKNALKYFKDEQIVGIQGKIYSDIQKKSFFDGAPVTLEEKNYVGGKTANMFYRKKIVLEVGGFDERFVMPFGPKKGFREDTDLAWRVETKGKIIFAPDVKVYHPPRPLTIKDVIKNQKIGLLDGLFFLKYPKIQSLKMIFGPKKLFFLKLPLRLPFFLLGVFYFMVKPMKKRYDEKDTRFE